jgi:hypothetical protein
MLKKIMQFIPVPWTKIHLYTGIHETYRHRYGIVIYLAALKASSSTGTVPVWNNVSLQYGYLKSADTVTLTVDHRAGAIIFWTSQDLPDPAL